MKRATVIWGLLLILICASAQAQTTLPAGGNSNGPADSAARHSVAALPPEKASPVTVSRFDKPPVIDGKLDEEVWKTAVRLKDFYQTRPGDNIAPSHPTEVMLGYDSKSLYIAFRVYDDPTKVRANVPKRDQIFDDDFVNVILDTFNDRRKAYILAFNPLGVQADGIRSEDADPFSSGSEDFNVDVVMESKGLLTEDGYVVEVAIPFKSLRYEAGKGKLWGIHAFRHTKRLDNETSSWMPISRDKSSLLSQEGHITGLEGISTEHALEVIPTLTISETGRRVRTLPLAVVDSDPTIKDPGRFVNKPLKADPGVTVKFGITPNVTLDFAVNPDFAQVEADEPVVTANQRFPIFFAEKRPFFLEGIDIFQTPIQVVHTRAIIDPDYAAKLSGKRGRTSFGLLLASDNAPGDFSEEERRDPTSFADIARFVGKNAYVGVARVKRDVGRESTIGLIATSYNFIEKHNHLAGVDGRFRIDKQTTFTFQALGTSSRRFFYNPDSDRDEYRTGKAFSYYFNLDNTGRNTGYSIQAQGRTRDYRADVGFTRRTNTNYAGIFFRYSTDPRPKAFFLNWRWIGGVNSNFDWQGRSQQSNLFSGMQLFFTRQTQVGVNYSEFYERLFEEEFGPRRSAARGGAFFGNDSERSLRGRALSAFMETNPTNKYQGFMFIGHRWNVFDFDFGAGPRYPRVSRAALADPDAALDPGPAGTFDLGAGFTYQPAPALKASVNYNKSRFVRNETDRTVFDSNIYTLRVSYQFTRFTFARARVDYDSLSSALRGQYLVGWTPNPGTSFYAGYNDVVSVNGFNPFTEQHEPGFRRGGRTFFIKTSYLFRRSI